MRVTQSNLITRAAKLSRDVFTVTRFKQQTQKERERAWLEYRKQGVGGSDMSVILGISKWRTPVGLWQEKTGRVTPARSEDNWAIAKGKFEEPELRRWFAKHHPELVVVKGTDISLASVPHPFMHASLDGWLYDPESESFGVLEIKTANAFAGRTEWHDLNNDLRIPDYYKAQVTHYLAVTGFTWGYVYADIGGTDPVEIRFERDEDDVQAVTRKASDFWKLVETDQMPALKASDVATVFPDPEPDILDMNGDENVAQLLEEYDAAKAAKKAVDAELKSLQESLTVLIGNHSGVRANGYEATYKTYHRKGYTRTVPETTGRRFNFRQLASKEEQ